MITETLLKTIMQRHRIEAYAYYRLDGDNEETVFKREEWLESRIQNLECTPKESRFLRYGADAHHAVKSILVALFPYDTARASQNAIGKVDGFAYGFDYHICIKHALQGVLQEIETVSEPLNDAQIHVDTSPFIDREIAFYGGLGRYGKNHCLINPIFGTQFFIGYIAFETQPNFDSAINLRIDAEKSLYPLCEGCSLCNRACPVNICSGPLGDASVCVGMLTQTKRTLTLFELEAMGKQLYGCSLCQRACPANRLSVASYFKAFDDEPIELRTLLGLSNKAFKKMYGHMAFAWRPVNVYKRNALVNLAWYGTAEDMDYLLLHKEMLTQPFLLDVYTWTVETMQKRLKYCDIFRNA